jgi:hypothetical protein
MYTYVLISLVLELSKLYRQSAQHSVGCSDIANAPIAAIHAYLLVCILVCVCGQLPIKAQSSRRSPSWGVRGNISACSARHGET